MKAVRFGIAICWRDDWQNVPYFGSIGEQAKKQLDSMLEQELKDGLQMAEECLDPYGDPIRASVLNKILAAKFEVRERDISCVLLLTPKEQDELDTEISDGAFCSPTEETVEDGEKELYIDWFLEDPEKAEE